MLAIAAAGGYYPVGAAGSLAAGNGSGGKRESEREVER
jgi:hypothetical protein